MTITFVNQLELLLNDPQIMFLIVEICDNLLFSEILPRYNVLADKIAAIRNPSVEICSNFNDSVFIENIQLSLLVKKSLKTESISMNELKKQFSLVETEQSMKNIQRLIMKAIQLNLIDAVIDKKSNKVFFL